MNKRSATVLSYATPGSKEPVGLPSPPFYRRSVFWIVVRRMTFVLGMALFGMGIGGVLAREDILIFFSLGLALIGLCIPLGPLPPFMREDEARTSEEWNGTSSNA